MHSIHRTAPPYPNADNIARQAVAPTEAEGRADSAPPTRLPQPPLGNNMQTRLRSALPAPAPALADLIEQRNQISALQNSNWRDFTGEFRAVFHHKKMHSDGAHNFDVRAGALVEAWGKFQRLQAPVEALSRGILKAAEDISRDNSVSAQALPGGNAVDKLTRSIPDMQRTAERNLRQGLALMDYGNGLLAYGRLDAAERARVPPMIADATRPGPPVLLPAEGDAAIGQYAKDTIQLLLRAMDALADMGGADATLFKIGEGLNLLSYGGADKPMNKARELIIAARWHINAASCDLDDISAALYNRALKQHTLLSDTIDEAVRRLDQTLLADDAAFAPRHSAAERVLDECIRTRKNTMVVALAGLDDIQCLRNVDHKLSRPADSELAEEVSTIRTRLLFACANMLRFLQTKLDLSLLTFPSGQPSNEAKQMCDLHMRSRNDIWRMTTALEWLTPDAQTLESRLLAPELQFALAAELQSRMEDLQTQCAFLATKCAALSAEDVFERRGAYTQTLKELIYYLGDTKDAIGHYVRNTNKIYQVTVALRGEAREVLKDAYRSTAELAQDEQEQALRRESLIEEAALEAAVRGPAASHPARKKKAKPAAPRSGPAPPPQADARKSSGAALATSLSLLWTRHDHLLPSFEQAFSRAKAVLDENPEMSPHYIKQYGERAAAYLQSAITMKMQLAKLTSQLHCEASPASGSANAAQLRRDIVALEGRRDAVLRLTAGLRLSRMRTMFIQKPTLALYNALYDEDQIVAANIAPRQLLLGTRNASGETRKEKDRATILEICIALSPSTNHQEPVRRHVALHLHYDRETGSLLCLHLKRWDERALGDAAPGGRGGAAPAPIHRHRIDLRDADGVMRKINAKRGHFDAAPRKQPASPPATWA